MSDGAGGSIWDFISDPDVLAILAWGSGIAVFLGFMTWIGKTTSKQLSKSKEKREQEKKELEDYLEWLGKADRTAGARTDLGLYMVSLLGNHKTEYAMSKTIQLGLFIITGLYWLHEKERLLAPIAETGWGPKLGSWFLMVCLVVYCFRATRRFTKECENFWYWNAWFIKIWGKHLRSHIKRAENKESP